MEGSTRPHVSLVKPGREPEIPTDVLANVEATVGTSETMVLREITPEHIAQEPEPPAMRAITPEHICEEVVPSLGIDTNILFKSIDIHGDHEVSSKHTKTNKRGTKSLKAKTKLSNKASSKINGKTVVYSRTTAKLLIDVLDNNICEKLFGKGAVSPHIGDNNRVYCKRRNKRNLYDVSSSAIDNLQFLLELLALPNSDFYDIFEFVEYCSDNKLVPLEFYEPFFTLLKLIYKNEEDSVREVLDSESDYIYHGLVPILDELVFCGTFTHKYVELQTLSRYIFSNLENILKRETCFTISPLFIFVCMNMCADDVLLDSNSNLTERHQLERTKSLLEAYGRASYAKTIAFEHGLKIAHETSALCNKIGNLDSDFALFIGCGPTGISMAVCVYLIAFHIVTVDSFIVSGIVSLLGWLCYAGKRVCQCVSKRRRYLRRRQFKALGFQMASIVYPALKNYEIPKLIKEDTYLGK